VPADQFRQILARGPGAASRRPAILEAEEEFGV
jgi:hypothetical protein